jgi:hypothetical protein
MMALIAEARAEAEKINGIPEEERIANIFKNQIRSSITPTQEDLPDFIKKRW